MATLILQSVSLAEAAWKWNTHRLPRVLAVQGLWNEQYRLPEALSEAGGANLIEALHYHGAPSSGLHYLRGEGAYDLPRKPEDLFGYDLLVLTNVAARTFSEEQVQMIGDFVSNGGGLLLLGGYWTLDKGGMRGTPLEEILPVRIDADRGRLPYDLKGLPLEPKGSHPVTALADWSAKPCVFFYNRVSARDGATVPLAAGEHPMLILGQHGKGRTAVFAGSVCGVAPEGVTPIWDWDDWPVFLANVIEWLWLPRRQMPQGTPVAAPEGAGGLSEAELEELEFAEGDEKVALIRKAVGKCNAETAAALVGELTANDELETDVQVSVMKAVRPFARPAWAKPLLGMVSRLDPGSRVEWLSLLGATRSPDILPVLLKSTDAADTDVRRAALSGLALLGMTKAVPKLRGLYSQVPEFEAEAQTDEDQVRSVLPGPEDLRIDILLALYRCGSPGTPRQVLDAYDQHLFYLGFVSAYLRSPGPKPSDKQGRLIRKDLYYRRRFLRSQLRQIEERFIEVPTGLERDFVQAATAEVRPHCLRLLYQALGTSLKPGNALMFVDLSRASDPGIARLATSTILQQGGEEAGRAVLASITDEWNQAEPGKRRGLLMLARLLAPEARKSVVKLGLDDPDPRVSRRAKALDGGMPQGTEGSLVPTTRRSPLPGRGSLPRSSSGRVGRGALQGVFLRPLDDDQKVLLRRDAHRSTASAATGWRNY